MRPSLPGVPVRELVGTGRLSVPDSLAWLRRGRAHRRRLAEIDTTVVVSGTRGKSSLTRFLHDAFVRRDHDTLAKLTGNHPETLRNGGGRPVDRGERVTLYENERELRERGVPETLLLENQGITDYTTRVFNETFAAADVVAITNVRRDHLGTLGDNRQTIARSLCRSVPAGAHVVNAEPDPALRRYMAAELERRGATVTGVDVPAAHDAIPGSEVVYAVDAVLRAVGEAPLTPMMRESMLEDFRVEWSRLEGGGRIFNAAAVNDVESTEIVRRRLQGEERIEPFVHLRADRRARTISFVEYLSSLAGRRVFEQVHVAGGHADLFARETPFPVVVHDKSVASPAALLDSLLSSGRPVFVAGNTVAPFMREFCAEIERRTVDDPGDAHHERGTPEEARNAGGDRLQADD